MIITILCLLILISSITSIIVDITRLKAVKENTKAYRELKKTSLSLKNDIDIYVKEQEKNSISIDKLTDEIIRKIAVKSIKDINKIVTNERKGVD